MFSTKMLPMEQQRKTLKTLNCRWTWVAPLVSKWCRCVVEAYRKKSSGANEELILQNAHDLYECKVGKMFDLMHWWYLHKDQPKWETICDQFLEASTKRLRINDVGGYSNSSTPGTPGSPSTFGTLGDVNGDDTPTNEVGGII